MNWQWAQETVKSYPVRRMSWTEGWRLEAGSDGKLVYRHPTKGKPTTFVAMQLDKDAVDWIHLDPGAVKRAAAEAATKATQKRGKSKPKAKAK